ncbi:quinol dehydrogenase ferredoxin subunit NapH [Helicobacter sp. 11S03491-1]|uniref:quinol dehydrogenase ferredoxin subunit NapH n=1 Tax=Helicobacter sp. 11S03491-1 TaxID=1476196 RepID=UPI000BA5F0C8|nr:quinol dehydrogenase ferredoxin subunit NapH [Helicobacter sp. 11S03491-1]PAF41119.1 quinol dehydrogenase ferredoxin subunit NapH [Helicobacter sp. 11S03491-1]
MVKYRFLILRRIFQIGILILFFLGNASWISVLGKSHIVYQGNIGGFDYEGKNLAIGKTKTTFLPILQGNLSSSKIFGVIPMSDPLGALELILAGGVLAWDIYLGLLLVIVVYGVFFGRAYCSYVCPLNLATDLAGYLRRITGLSYLPKQIQLNRNAKYGVLFLSLLLSFVFGVAVFEMINPIGMLYRGIVFGMGIGFLGVLVVFLFDLLLLKNGFCGHICPVGAIFSLIGKYSIWRVKYDFDKCTRCMKCVQVCSENQVLHMVGKHSSAVADMACIKCGRCIEVCDDKALQYGIVNLIKRR